MFQRVVSCATLLMSLSTLVCCALPALFVALGAGATFVSLLGVFPQLVWFSENKGIVFLVAGVLLVANTLMRIYVPQSCPADSALAAECQRAQRFSAALLKFSIGMYLVGAFFAFVAPLIFG
jgi:hypothetical protein